MSVKNRGACEVGKSYNFTQAQKVGKWEIQIDPAAGYGYFEHDDEGEGGGLWIVKGELVDFDGRSCLPYSVGRALEILGYRVGEENFVSERGVAEQDGFDFYVPGRRDPISMREHFPSADPWSAAVMVEVRERFFRTNPRYRFAE